MGARIAAMAHHPNDGNHAGTNLSTPFNVLPFCLSVSRTSLSLSPFSPLFLPLLVARFSADTSPRYRLSSTPRHFRFRWSNQPIWVRFFDPPATFTQHTSPFYSTFAIIRTRRPFIRPVFASVSRLTHLRPISRGAKRWWIPMIEPGTWRRDTILNQANCSRFIIDEVCIKWFLVWRERGKLFQDRGEDPSSHFPRNKSGILLIQIQLLKFLFSTNWWPRLILVRNRDGAVPRFSEQGRTLWRKKERKKKKEWRKNGSNEWKRGGTKERKISFLLLAATSLIHRMRIAGWILDELYSTSARPNYWIRWEILIR